MRETYLRVQCLIYNVDTNVMISLLADNSWLVMEEDVITILQPEEWSCSSDFP